MTRILWIELRRSPLRWWLPFLVVVDITMLFTRSTDWIGVWPQASAAAQLPGLYISIILAAGAAWASGRALRSDSAEQFTAAATAAWQREFAQLAATVTYGLIPLLTGAVVAAAVTVGKGGPGFLWPSYLLLGALLIVLSATLGHLLGRVIRHRTAAPLVGPVIVFLIVGFQAIPFLQLTVLSGAPQVQVEPLALVARAALAVALLATVALLGVGQATGWRRSGTRATGWTRSVPALQVAVVLLGIGLVVVTGPLVSMRPAPAEPLCSGSAPRVCVWPEQRVHLPTVTALAERMTAFAGTLSVPDTFYEEGLRAPMGTNSDFALVFGDWATARGMASSVLIETLGVRTCTPPPSEAQDRNIAAYTELKEWVVARAYGPKPSDVHGGFQYDEAELARVLTLPHAEQARWAQQRINTVRETNCA